MNTPVIPRPDELPDGEPKVLEFSTPLDDAAEAEAEAAAFQRLAAMSLQDYDRCRREEAKSLGLRPPTLDKIVSALRRAKEDEAGGTAVAFDDPEPWPEAVAGADLLNDLAATAQRYLVLPTGAAEAIALWILLAHTHDTATISPILAVTSPTPECGKTTLLTMLGVVVPRPLPASNITAAALFRAVEKWRPTLLVDEADTFLRNSDELRGIINSGHNKNTAFVIRTAGDDHEPRLFRTWAPKAIALIGRLPPTLESRSVHVELRRMAEGEHVEPLRGDRLGHLEPLRRRAWRWASDNAVTLANLDPEMPSTLHGRAADNWRSMVGIADVASGDWPQRARRAADVLAAGRSEQTAGVMLLEDIHALFAERSTARLPSNEIVQALGAMEDRPWSEWKAGKPITARQLAKLLLPFKINPTKFRAAGYTPGTRGYELTDFTDTFARWLQDPPIQSATAPQPSKTATSDASYPPQNSNVVADKPGPKPTETAECGAVADGEPQSWENEL